jgi:hypothetical protein
MAGEEGPRLRVHHRKLLPVSAQNTHKDSVAAGKSAISREGKFLATRLYQNKRERHRYIATRFRIRIRIGSGFNQVSGSRRAKNDPQKIEKS